MCIPLKIANPIYGGMEMNVNAIWQVFLDTGAPEVYLLYHKARQMGEHHVFDDTGSCITGDSL